jgi:hypothetical protein
MDLVDTVDMVEMVRERAAAGRQAPRAGVSKAARRFYRHSR